jgi:hypothetical protein
VAGEGWIATAADIVGASESIEVRLSRNGGRFAGVVAESVDNRQDDRQYKVLIEHERMLVCLRAANVDAKMKVKGETNWTVRRQ